MRKPICERILNGTEEKIRKGAEGNGAGKEGKCQAYEERRDERKAVRKAQDHHQILLQCL